MKLLSAIVNTVKASPVKSAAVVVGSAGVIAGSVYAVKKYRTIKSSKAIQVVEANVPEANVPEANVPEAKTAPAVNSKAKA